MILFQESTWNAGCSHFPLHITMHSWFPVEANFSILEIVSEFLFSAAPCMLHTRSMSYCALLLVFLVRIIKRFFSPFCLRVKVIACRLVYDLIVLPRMYSVTFVNVRRLVLTFPGDIAVPFDERELSNSPDIQVTLFFCLVGFMQALVLGELIFLRSEWFSLGSTLVWLANVPISSNVTKWFIREIHFDLVLWFNLLFHWYPASQFGHIDRHMVVDVLMFVIFLTTSSMTYLSTSLSKSFCYCWNFFDICFWVSQ